MTILKGHYDGKTIVLDEPVPEEISADTPVQILFEGNSGESVLDRIAKLARPANLPPDFSEQDEHYVKGRPRVGRPLSAHPRPCIGTCPT